MRVCEEDPGEAAKIQSPIPQEKKKIKQQGHRAKAGEQGGLLLANTVQRGKKGQEREKEKTVTVTILVNQSWG